MIKFKFPLQPHQKYNTIQYGERGFSSLTQMKDDYSTNSHYLRLGECTFLLLFQLRDELSRETELRSSLEASHLSLLQRVSDMDEIVETERQDVQKLASECTNLSQEARKDYQKEHSLRRQLEGLATQCQESSGMFSNINPFTPESDQCQISPAASPEIWHHIVWRTWLFIAYTDERWLYHQFSLPHTFSL